MTTATGRRCHASQPERSQGSSSDRWRPLTVDRLKPLHLALVGGDPLVRHREVEALVPLLLSRGIHVQIVTSAFRQMPGEWKDRPHLTVSVSIDGLQAEHDVRRAPATYERILKNIANQRVNIHTTVTGQMMKQPGYLRRFLEFWTPRAEIKKVWLSLFTPQVGDKLPEILTPRERTQVIADLLELRKEFRKLEMPESLIRQFSTPPRRPEDCVFALTTKVLSADLETKVTPCQYGGNPDCSSCGCMASMGMAAVAAHKIGGVFPIKPLFWGIHPYRPTMGPLRPARAAQGARVEGAAVATPSDCEGTERWPSSAPYSFPRSSSSRRPSLPRRIASSSRRRPGRLRFLPYCRERNLASGVTRTGRGASRVRPAHLPPC